MYAAARSPGACARTSAEEEVEAKDEGDKESIGNVLFGSESD